MLARVSFLLFACALLATPAAAQSSAVQLPLFDGALVLHGEVGILADARTDTSADIEVWRPVLFGTPERPIGGRMDCRLGGVTRVYSEALFDIEQRYRDTLDRRKAAGLNDRETAFTETGAIRRLEVTGTQRQPTRHYVLTWLALRGETTLYDIRLNCEFTYLERPGRDTDFAAIMRSHIDLAVPDPAPVSAQTEGS